VSLSVLGRGTEKILDEMSMYCFLVASNARKVVAKLHEKSRIIQLCTEWRRRECREPAWRYGLFQRTMKILQVFVALHDRYRRPIIAGKNCAEFEVDRIRHVCYLNIFELNQGAAILSNWLLQQ